MNWFLAIKIVSLLPAMGFWYYLWTRQTRPLWPFVLIACAWCPSFISSADWSYHVNFFADCAFVLALVLFSGDRWNRLKRQLKGTVAGLTDTARAAFARQVREAS